MPLKFTLAFKREARMRLRAAELDATAAPAGAALTPAADATAEKAAMDFSIIRRDIDQLDLETAMCDLSEAYKYDANTIVNNTDHSVLGNLRGII